MDSISRAHRCAHCWCHAHRCGHGREGFGPLFFLPARIIGAPQKRRRAHAWLPPDSPAKALSPAALRRQLVTRGHVHNLRSFSSQRSLPRWLFLWAGLMVSERLRRRPRRRFDLAGSTAMRESAAHERPSIPSEGCAGHVCKERAQRDAHLLH